MGKEFKNDPNFGLKVTNILWRWFGLGRGLPCWIALFKCSFRDFQEDKHLGNSNSCWWWQQKVQIQIGPSLQLMSCTQTVAVNIHFSHFMLLRVDLVWHVSSGFDRIKPERNSTCAIKLHFYHGACGVSLQQQLKQHMRLFWVMRSCSVW